VRIRAARRHAMDSAKKMQKDGGITEDDLKGAEGQIQKLTDKYVAEVDGQVAAKEADVMRV
jgi:ribosome recycling factor